MAVEHLGQWCHPTAPPSWGCEPAPRHKPYEATRPNDFKSFKEIPEREGLLRLIVGRLITADGHDIQDDYTLPIEKQFHQHPLSYILKWTYGPARGIPNRAQIHVKFMLSEAGAGLGWLDVEKSPEELQLKDSDIVEVLVTRETAGQDVDHVTEAMDRLAGGDIEAAAARNRWAAKSWEEAVAYFSEVKSSNYAMPNKWIPKVWGTLDKYSEDDNVVHPGLECFLGYIEAAKNKDAQQAVVADRDGVGILRRVLGVHCGNASIQVAGWDLCWKLGSETFVQPLLVQRAGIRALARKLQKRPECEDSRVQSAIATFVKSMAKVPGPDTATKTAGDAVVNPFLKAAAAPAQRSSKGVTKSSTCSQLAVNLERAMRQNDTMRVDKILRSLIGKMQVYAFDHKEAEEAGLGRLLGELTSFDGDADVRELSRKAVQLIAKLQFADPLR